MVYDAGRHFFHVEVRHHIGTDYHGAVLFIESVYHGLQSMLVFVYIVTVELDSELAAFLVMDTCVPASSDTEIISFGDYMNQPM